jgi:GNAT superfamily N-acetyltransferase
MTITIRTVGVEQGSEVRRMMQLAFEEYRGQVIPPSRALMETIDDVRTAIRGGGAFLAFAGDVAVGSAGYRLFPDRAYSKRIAVLPAHRGRGIATALMAAFEEAVHALGAPEARVNVRASPPSNLRFYENLGYRALASRPYPTGSDFELTLILGGFVVWAACLGMGTLVASASATSTTIATTVFVVMWFLAASANLWVGVMQAGYSFTEELPIFFGIFVLPVATAAVVKWKFL